MKIGDVVEFRGRNGFIYALYTHRHDKPPRMGAVLRVASRVKSARPTEFSANDFSNILFTCFFPLAAAVRKGVVNIAGNINIPEELREFPIFRSGIADPRTGGVGNWRLWDGEREWPIGALSEEQKKFPIKSALTDVLIVERAEAGWRAEVNVI